VATKEELSDQLVMTQKLASAIDQMAKSMSRVEQSFDTQIGAVEKLTRAVEGLKGQDLSQLNATKLTNLQKELSGSEKLVKSLSGRIKEMGTWVSKKFPGTLAVGVSALSGFMQGLKNVIALGKGVTGFFAGIIDGLVNVTASIIAIPFKMFNALVDIAANASGGSNELAEALENLRKELGDFAEPSSRAVLDAADSLAGFADTGLNAFRVFGTLAEKLQLVTKVAVAMGATFGMLVDEFKANGGALLAYQKGLGVSDEQMKAIGDTAIRIGKPMAKVFLDMTKQTLALGKAFGISQKVIGKDMSKAMQDVRHFGALTVKEIAQASVYARKLGLELDKITGTLDAFETFDSAAESAAKLSQAFGVQIDAFKMMEAQNPAEQIDMLKKSFAAAGVDASDFTRQQAKLLATTTGLDEATVRQAFSMKNQGVRMDDLKKKSEQAEKKTMSQAEAMSKLAASIERLVKSGGGQQAGGFWDMFVKGFLGGIQSSKEFRSIIMNIKVGLNQVYMQGMRLGRAFVELFPGVKKFLGGIAEFFQPGKFKSLAGGVTDVFIQFMKDLSDPHGKASFASLMDKLRDKFFDFFDKESTSGRKMLDGFKTIFKTLTRLVAEAIKWVADKVAETLRFVTDVIRDPSRLISSAKGSTSGTLGFLEEVLAPIVDSLKYAWKVIAPAMWDLIKTIGKKAYDYFTSDEFTALIKPIIPYVAGILFGPALGRALLGALVTSITQAGVGLLTGAGKKAIQSLGTNVAKVAEASAKVPKTDTSAIKAAGDINAATGKAVNADKGSSWGVKEAVKLGLKLVAIAAALAAGGVIMAETFVVMKKILDSGGIKSISDAIGPMVILGTMVTAAIPLMLAMKIAAKVGSAGDILKGGLVIAAAVAIVGATGAGLAYLLKSTAKPAELAGAGDLMLKMSLVFLSMVPLILASMAIGALATGPQAIVLAAAAIGMGVIAGAVAEIASLSVSIIKEISALKVESDFQRKIDAFLSIMKAIQAFSDTLVHMVGLMTPTFTEFVTGRVESFSEKVDAAVKLIREMVGERGSGRGIIGVVEVVMDSIKKLNVGGPGMAEAAKIFADVMQGITDFMKSAAPPDAFYEQGGSFINKLVDPSHNFQSLATDVNFYVTNMRKGAMEMLTGKADGSGDDGIIGIIKKMATLDVPDPEKAQVVANLIGGMSQILKSITPSSETMKAFTDTSELSAGWGLVKTKASNLNVKNIQVTIETMATQMSELLPTLVDTLIDKVVETAKDLTPAQVENVKSLVSLLGTVSSIAASIATVAKGSKSTPMEVNGATEWATESAPDLQALFEGMAEALPKLFNAVIDTVNSVVVDSNISKRLEDLQKLFGFIGEVPKLAQSIAALSKKGAEGEGDVANIEPLLASINAMSYFFQKLIQNEGTGSTLEMLVTNIKNVGTRLQSLGSDKVAKVSDQLKGLFASMASLTSSFKTMTTTKVDPDEVSGAINRTIFTVSKSVDALQKVTTTLTPEALKDVSSSISRLKDYGDQVSKITTALKGDAIATALKAASDMVKAANDLDTALNSGIKIDTPVKLKKLATAVGLGSKTNYTITNKMVQLTVNLNVTMEAGEVEKVIVMRKSSIIRERLNFALENPSDKASPSIPETYSSGFNAGSLAPSTG